MKATRNPLAALSTGQDQIRAQEVEDLLLRAGRAIGLSISYHDRLHRLAIHPNLNIHRSRFCRQIKRHDEARCIAFDSLATHQALAGLPNGRIQTCPFGATEIVVPVFAGGVYAGVLFAGTCWVRGRKAPDASLVVPPTRVWLADLLVLMRGVARELAALLIGPSTEDRRSAHVLEFLRNHMTESVYLTALARHLSLSPSRVRHLVKELFGVRFTALVQATKLQEAARLLRTTDFTISEIAARVGIGDSNYLSRIFRNVFGVSPRDFRRQHHTSP